MHASILSENNYRTNGFAKSISRQEQKYYKNDKLPGGFGVIRELNATARILQRNNLVTCQLEKMKTTYTEKKRMDICTLKKSKERPSKR